MAQGTVVTLAKRAAAQTLTRRFASIIVARLNSLSASNNFDLTDLTQIQPNRVFG
jgi:hypothetical protein